MTASKGASPGRRRVEHPFPVEVGELRRSPGTRRRVSLEGSLAGLAVSGSEVPGEATIHFQGLLESVHDGILVSGVVRAPWSGPCRRCLRLAEGELLAEVRELCVERGDAETTYPLDGDQLDLEPMIHDACILDLPLAPLCGEGCLGLCPECGADRNVEPCSCAPAADPRFAGLSVLTGGRGLDPAAQPQPGRGAGDRRRD